MTAVVALQAIDLPAPRQIIVVNDGSSDGTAAALDAIAGPSPLLTIVHANVNRGKGHAIQLGMSLARGQVIATYAPYMRGELVPTDRVSTRRR